MKDRVLAVVCMAFAASCLAATFTFPTTEAIYRSPAVYPRVVIAAVVILSAILAIGEFVKRRKARPAAGGPTSSFRLPTLLLAAITAYCLLMPIAGFVIATFGFVLACFLLFGGKLRSGLSFATAMTAGQYILFALLLDVRVPDPVVAFISKSL